MSNVVPGQYRGVAVAAVDIPLTAAALTRHFTGREAYHHTRFVVARSGGDTALLGVTKAGGGALFSPITAVEVLALPHDTAYVRAPEVDTAVPAAVGRVAVEQAAGARCVVVEGRYQHVSFILDPAPIRIRVGDVVPPRPAKLYDQARRVLALAEDLPPIDLVPDVVDLVDLARAAPADHYLLPCRGSGFTLDGPGTLAFLDERPPYEDWTLIGCQRSRDIHQWFYGQAPCGAVEMCPRRLFPADGSPLLTKCCLLENDNEAEGTTATVPWGATLDLVKRAMAGIATAADPAWAPA